MQFLDYCYGEQTDDFVAKQSQTPSEFYWSGKLGAIESAIMCLMTYIHWRRKQQGSGLYTSSSSSSFFNDSQSTENEQKEKSVINKKDGKWLQLQSLFDSGLTYKEMIGNKEKYKQYQFMLIKHKNNWAEYEQIIKSKKKAPKHQSAVPSLALFGEFGYDPNKNSIRTMHRILDAIMSWYRPNFVQHNPEKGDFILWLWSTGSSVGKTTFWKEGLAKIGQAVLELEVEKNGWFQSFEPNSAACLVVDGYRAEHKSMGLGIRFLEIAGHGGRAILPQRNKHIQPTTMGEAILITSNAPYSDFFDADECSKVLATRVISVEVSSKYNLFGITDLLLRANGRPPLPKPQIRLPRRVTLSQCTP